MGSPVRQKFQNRTKSQFQKPWGGGWMGPIPEFQREHGVSGEAAEFSKRTKSQFQKPWGAMGGPIPEFQSEHGVSDEAEFRKLTNCQYFKTMGISK